MERIKTIFNKSESIGEFVKRADHYGYGLYSIRDMLRDNDIEITEDEIDNLR